VSGRGGREQSHVGQVGATKRCWMDPTRLSRLKNGVSIRNDM